jgi:hypothetical protein
MPVTACGEPAERRVRGAHSRRLTAIYALVEQGLLDPLPGSLASGRGLRISSSSVERRLHAAAPGRSTAQPE